MSAGPPTSVASQGQATPMWAWIFVVACVAIPVVSLGGAIPGALGGGGAFACYTVARRPTGAGTRVAACAGIVLACWLAFVAFAVAVAAL